MTQTEIEDRFTYHAPTPAGVGRHRQLTEAFVRLACLVNDIVPPGREQSLVLTKLEEAKFFASAGVARNEATR